MGLLYQRDEILRMGTDPVHRWRHARYKGGEKLKNIAKNDGVRVVDIRRSVHAVEMFDAMYSAPTLEANEIRMLNDLVDLEEAALRSMLKAVREEKDEKGNLVSTEDHETRARALDIANDRLQILLDKRASKVPLVGLNVQQTSVSVQTAEGAMSFERSLREIQAKRATVISSQPLPELPAPPPPDLTLDMLDSDPVEESVDASRS